MDPSQGRPAEKAKQESVQINEMTEHPEQAANARKSWNFILCATAVQAISIIIATDLHYLQDLLGLPGFSYQLKYKMFC